MKRTLIKTRKKLFIFTFFIFLTGYIFVSNYQTSSNDKTNLIKQNLEKREIKKEIQNVEITSRILTSTRISTKIKNLTKRKRFFAVDASGMAIMSTSLEKCDRNLEVEIRPVNLDEKNDFVYSLDRVPGLKTDREKYVMVFAMESEPHSIGGEPWIDADFKMWYNLDLSFPAPATYFDMHTFLPDLLSPPKVNFKDKEQNSSLVWILSNCNAYNGRERYVEKLMTKLNVDSYGYCLQNKFSHTNERMRGNIDLYSKYKFVIAIENSNCQDYVTEKLVHAVASGSIPIVAGKNNKPDYLRFMPKNSYINIYDYKTIDDLVLKIKSIAENPSEYESYIKFKRKHNFTREALYKKSLNELIDLAKTVFDPNEMFIQNLVLKETSESKLCKVARYLQETPEEIVRNAIKSHKQARPSPEEACLPRYNIVNDFKLE